MVPLPKCHATLLKRLALLAGGQAVPEVPVFGELAPAMAVHHGLHQQLYFEALPEAEQRRLSASSDWQRLAFVRHPVERLFRVWYFKIFLDDPFYRARLCASLALPDLFAEGDLIPFSDFVSLVMDNGPTLMASDPHLAPQAQLLSRWSEGELEIMPCSAFASFVDEGLLPRLEPAAQVVVRQEMERHHRCFGFDPLQEHAADLTPAQLAAIESLYAEDLRLSPALSSRIPAEVGSSGSKAVELHRAVSHLEGALRTRHRQLAMLLDSGLASKPRHCQAKPTESTAVTLVHGDPVSGLKPLYDALLQQQADAVLAALGAAMPVQDALQAEREYLRGLAHLLLGRHEQAWHCFEACLQAGYQSEYLLFNAANALRGMGRWADALAYFDRALCLESDFPECQHNRALTLVDLGSLAQAVIALRLLLNYSPDFYQAAFSLGNVLRQQGLLPEAIRAYQMALAQAPDYVDALNNMGLCHAAIGEQDQAIRCYRTGLSVRSDDVNCLQNLAHALTRVRAHQQAQPEYLYLLSLSLTASQQAGAVQGYVGALLELGELQAAQDFVDSQSEPLLRDLYGLHLLPVIYESVEQVEQVRARYASSLERLVDTLDDIQPSHPLYEIFYAHSWLLTNFYLAYQMEDDRALQEGLSTLLAGVLRHRFGAYMDPAGRLQSGQCSKQVSRPNVMADRPLRVGFVSSHLRNHNGCFWSLAFFHALAEAGDFELFAYNLGDESDYVTNKFAQLGCLRQLSLKQETAEQVFACVKADHLDFLFFTDVGMHPASKVMSLMRLASVQAVGWGHPITTGSNAMDWYVTGEDMETERSPEFYSERLCLLPGTGLSYDPPLIEPVDIDLLGHYQLPQDRPLLLSLQSSFKYHPAHDSLYAQISARHPEVLILLVEHMGHASVSQRLLSRLSRAYRDHGLEVESHVRVLPRLSYAHYVNLFGLAHHALDTPDWNGGNSSFQAFAQACPVVTWPGRFMRGRHSVAMLRVMELEGLVAADAQAYVDLSCRLLEDSDFAAEMRAAIAERSHRLFRDQAPADAFVAAVRRLCGRSV